MVLFLQGIEGVDFPELRPLLAPLMHTVCLVYANSSYYNTTARIIVLMQVRLAEIGSPSRSQISNTGNLQSSHRCCKTIFGSSFHLSNRGETVTLIIYLSTDRTRYRWRRLWTM